MTKIKLIIADNHIIFREGLVKLFESENDFDIISNANNAKECFDVLCNDCPDLLILDLNLPHHDSIEIIRKLNEAPLRLIKILVLTGFYDRSYFSEVVSLGIDGYLLKKSDFAELKKAIISIMNGDTYITSDCVEDTTDVGSYRKYDIDKINQLTHRELDVLKNLSLGMYNKEIAIRLDISERTVKNHISSIFKKIGVSDRTQAAVFSIRNNLVNIYKI